MTIEQYEKANKIVGKIKKTERVQNGTLSMFYGNHYCC